MSDTSNVVFALRPRNERDATSAISFSSPAIETESSGDAFRALCLIARARRSLPATMECFDAKRFAHETVGVLSQYIATCEYCRSVTKYSNTNQCSTKPANSKSEFVISPVGFLSETSRFLISSGKLTLHTTGSNLL